MRNKINVSEKRHAIDFYRHILPNLFSKNTYASLSPTLQLLYPSYFGTGQFIFL